MTLTELIENYAEEVSDGMDIDTMSAFVQETIENRLDSEDESTVLETVNQFYPHLVREYNDH